VRSFEGGLNVTDTDLNMSPKYAKVLDNLERSTDGSLTLRPGTKLLTNHITDTSDIVNHVYFNGVIWSVQVSGNITTTDGAGTVTVKTIPAPGWTGGITFVDFTVFNSDLLIVNGKDKPLIVSGHPTRPDGSANPNFNQIQFLADLATTSNVNVPVGKYIIAHGQFTVIAGVTAAPSTIFISHEDSSGTWFGDGPPNNAVNLDLGPRVSLGGATITGMVAYRDKLLVTFERGVLPINLGVFIGTPSVHSPTDDGFIEEFGCLAHRSLVSVGDDTFFNDNVGVNSITRINVFNTLRPVRASHLVDPLITALIQPLSTAQIEKSVFAVYDLRNFRYMLFIPVLAADGVTVTETICFSYTNIPTLKITAWARLRGWKWQSACRTALQNIVFSRGNKLYTYDFDGTQNADRFGDPAVQGGTGEPVAFTWELPWADFKHRMDIKVTRYVSLDTTGKAQFTMETYVDNILDQPAYSAVPYIAGSGPGYGVDGYGNAYGGGGRRAGDERLLAVTAKFKLMKLRFFGSTKEKLRFISVSLAYLHGSIRR
jgi:hypothetical protein